MDKNGLKAWTKHFKGPRSTEVVEVPRDVFEFLLETNEAYGSIGGGDIAVVAAAQMLALDLLREVAHHDAAPDSDV